MSATGKEFGRKRETINKGSEVWRGIESFEFVGFIELKEQRRVKSCILLSGDNSINTTNPINRYVGLEGDTRV